jgi:hypothetical protein
LGKKRTVVVVGSMLIVIGIGIVAWAQYLNLQKQFQPKPTESVTNAAPPQQVLGLIEKVEQKGVTLPKNEFPSVATISDLSKLSDQAFFDGATVGDKVLIYANAKRAILFRPSTNQIIRESRVERADDPDSTPTSSESAVLSASSSAEPVLRIKF